MSEYEGKACWRKRNCADISDVLYYEATGELMPPDINKDIFESLEKVRANPEIENNFAEN